MGGGNISTIRKRKAMQKKAKKKGLCGFVWEYLVEACKGRCLACYEPTYDFTIDHIKPLSMGGTNDPTNIQPLCAECNNGGKGSSIVDYRTFEMKDGVEEIISNYIGGRFIGGEEEKIVYAEAETIHTIEDYWP